MLEVDAQTIADLGDAQLRELIERLCIAELRRHGQPISAVICGGDQDEADGGIDVRVKLELTAPGMDFVPRPHTGFQAKKGDLERRGILDEMRPKGGLRPSIEDLGDQSGAYVIVSGKASLTDKKYLNRLQAMREAIGKAASPHLDFYDGPRLARWVNEHPGVALWVRRIANQPLNGWMEWRNWSQPGNDQREPFLLDDEARMTDGRRPEDGLLSTAKGIDRIRAILSKPGGVVRLVGLSGTGKTRLAQALFETDVGNGCLPSDQAIYVDLGHSPVPSPQEMVSWLAKHGRPAIMIVDDCPPDTHRILAEMVASAGGTVSLLTIEHDIGEHLPEGSEVYRLNTASHAVIEELLAKRFPRLSRINRERIVELSGCNARLALAMAKNLPSGGSLGRLTDRQLYERLFWQGRGPVPGLQEAAETCALVYSFNVEDDGPEAELPILAALAGITTEALYSHVATLLRRQLAQQRGDWRAILPHVMANQLAFWALENLSPRKVVKALTSHPRLYTSFARRLGFLDSSPIAQAIVTEWLASGGMLGDLPSLDHRAWEILKLVAPVSPEQALAAIERAIANPQVLDTGYWHRRTICGLLASIAYEPQHFDRAIAALSQFVVAEPGDNQKNNAIDTFTTLFQIQNSGTMAGLDQRTAAADRLLANPDLRHAGRLALEAMLKTRQLRYPDNLRFGARPLDFGWRPPDGDTITRWFEGALNRVEACLDGEDRDWGRALLARQIPDLWRVGRGLPEMLEALSARVAGEEFWADAWISIRRGLRMWKKEGEETAGLRALAEQLAPRNLEEQAYAYVMSPKWGHHDIADADEDEDALRPWERVEAMAKEFGHDLAKQPAVLDRLLPRFSTTGQGRAWSFGRGLAAGAGSSNEMWDRLVAALAVVAPDKRDFALIGGFLRGQSEQQSNLIDCWLDKAIDHAVLRPMLTYMQSQVRWDDVGLNRMIQLAENQVVSGWAFRRMGPLRSLADEYAPLLARLVAAIAKLPDGGFMSAVDVLRFCIDDEKPSVPELAACGRELLRRWVPEKDQGNMLDFELEKIITASLPGPDGVETARAVANQLVEALADYRLWSGEYPRTQKALLTVQPMVVLDTLLLSEKLHKKWIYEADDDETPLSRLPDAPLLAWADQDRAIRYPRVAAVARLFTADGEPAPIMRHLIDHAPDRQAVLKAISGNLGPSGGMVDEVAALYMARTRGITVLFAHADQAVVTWAKAMHVRLQKEAELWSQDRHHRDERFE